MTVTFTDVSKAFDDRPALAGVSLRVAAGSRTAVVGPNGAGKSTLLKLAAGLLTPDSGTVAVAPGTAVGYVPQDYGLAARDGLAAAGSVADYVKQRAGILGLERELRALERRMAGGDDAAIGPYGEALERFGLLGGWELDGRIDQALATAGLPASVLERPLGELSGGQQVRVGLAGVLASRFGLYLLDEPTNNLDLAALDLLEGFVAEADATFVLVSHDRAFLRAVATDVVELDEFSHGAEAYGVGFGDYLAARERLRAARSARYRAYADEVGRLKGRVAAQRATAGRDGPKGPPRDNDKAARHFLAQRQSAKAARLARRLEQRLDRLQAVDKPREGWELRLALTPAGRGGELVAAADGVAKRYGDFQLGPLDLRLHWRERVALAGPNGAGKSVLLGLLTGAIAADQGQVRLGAGVVPGVLAQGGADLAGDGSGLDAFRARLPAWTQAEARSLLAKFDLGAEHVGRPVASWSPGERCRLGLAVLMAGGANWLVLDEPTNHLDIEALEELEQALAGFAGTLLVVSHDREFLARIGVTRRLELVDGRLRG